LQSLFTEIQSDWCAEFHRFPLAAKQDLDKFSTFDLAALFTFYKRVNAYSDQLWNFAIDTEEYRQQLKARHAKCSCQWGLQKVAFGYSWVAADPEGWPHWNLKCPYAIALEELEEATGRWREALSPRKTEEQHFGMVVQADELSGQGMIGFTPSAPVFDGHLSAIPMVWPCIDWIGTPWLNTVFDMAAQMEAASIHDSLELWLDSIDQGDHPGKFDTPSPMVELHESMEGLYLVRWHRKHRD